MNDLSPDEKELLGLEDTTLKIKDISITSANYKNNNQRIYRILFFGKKGAKVLTSHNNILFNITSDHHYIQICEDIDLSSLNKMKSLTIGADKKYKIILPITLKQLSLSKAHDLVNLNDLKYLRVFSICGIKTGSEKILYNLTNLSRLEKLELSDSSICLGLSRKIEFLHLFNCFISVPQKISITNVVAVNSKMNSKESDILYYYLNDSTIDTLTVEKDNLAIRNESLIAQSQISEYFKTKMSLLDFDILFQDSYKFGSFVFDCYKELSASDFEFIKLYSSLILNDNGKAFVDFLMLKQNSQSSSSS